MVITNSNLEGRPIFSDIGTKNRTSDGGIDEYTKLCEALLQQ
jgi:hypothetical protein